MFQIIKLIDILQQPDKKNRGGSTFEQLLIKMYIFFLGLAPGPEVCLFSGDDGERREWDDGN